MKKELAKFPGARGEINVKMGQSNSKRERLAVDYSLSQSVRRLQKSTLFYLFSYIKQQLQGVLTSVSLSFGEERGRKKHILQEKVVHPRPI